MKDFVAIDFETANPQRVSACALGYARISNCEVVETNGYLIKPVGGHAPFQSKIHGIKEEHTFDKPYFDKIYHQIKDIFDYPLIGHSLFDKQVLIALSEYFNLGLKFDYIDSMTIAKEHLPSLNNYKLETLVEHFRLPCFKHHNAKEDAFACAMVFLKLQNQGAKKTTSKSNDEYYEFKGIIKGILADQIVNYKEAYELLYWLEDHANVIKDYQNLHIKIKEFLSDDYLDCREADEIRFLLENILKEFK
ncbi:MAG TPA: exonuclease domain-containing protein [Verrucomicrobiota bacterium]|nr:exonuclease domain-containing protein [Verrucomicrobiota bacterium]